MTLKELESYTGPVIFSASWCGPCFTLKRQLKDKNIEAEIITVDEDDDGMAMAALHKVKTVPTLVVLDNGNTVKVVNGGNEILLELSKI